MKSSFSFSNIALPVFCVNDVVDIWYLIWIQGEKPLSTMKDSGKYNGQCLILEQKGYFSNEALINFI